MCSHPRLHPRLHTFRFHLLFKQLHVIINLAIIVVFVNMEMEVFLICLIESYQACKHWYRRGLQNKHTGSCRNYNFQVLKPQFVALSSPYPLSYRKTYHRPRGIAAKTAPPPSAVTAVIPLSPSPCSCRHHSLDFSTRNVICRGGIVPSRHTSLRQMDPSTHWR